MFINDLRIKIVAALLVALAVAIVIPTGTFAADNQKQAQGQSVPQAAGSGSENGGGKTTITREYTYKAGGAPDIPQRVSQFGQTLTLVSVSDPVESKTLPENREYTYQVSKSYTPDQLANAPKNVKLTPVSGTGSRQVDRAEKIENLPDNDVEKLPPRKTYSDTDGRGPGAGVSGDLALAEVKYEVTHRDQYGMPDKYTAHVVYRGEETYSAIMYYTATVTYTGEKIVEGEPTYTVVATYEGEAPAAVDTTENPPVADNAGAQAASNVADPGAAAGADIAGSAGSDAATGTAFVDGQSRFPSFLGELSPIGAAAFATVIAALITILIISVYNKRRIRESSQG